MKLSDTPFVVRRKLDETEKVAQDAIAERNAIEQGLREAQQRIQELESRLDEESRESSDMGVLRQRLSEEMEDERKQYQKDLADRDFSADQTRKKYFGEYLIFVSTIAIPEVNCGLLS